MNFNKLAVGSKFSPKDIPIPTDNEFRKMFISEQEKFGKRFAWSAFFIMQSIIHDDEDLENDLPQKPTYGFKSESKPPIVKEIVPFLNDFFAMGNKLEFRKYILTELTTELAKMKKSNKNNMIIAADKTRNLYTCDTPTYQKILNENITLEYKKANEGMIKDVNVKSAQFASELELENRMHAYTNTQCMITYKDHKENSITRPTFRLINPAKTDLGRVSKSILDNINEEIRSKTKLNQWRNTQTVLSWFNNLEKRKKMSFFKFDIQAFYPSISPELLINSIKFARLFCDICDKEFDIIMHCRRTFLFNNGEPWVKKGGKGNFDIPMGSFDGAEICELVGLYLLHKMTSGKDPIFTLAQVGLYRDDCLAVISGSARVIEDRVRKMFRKESLEIVAAPSAQITDFLDVELNLITREHKPYRKPNDFPIYINSKSNHPNTIIKQLPKMIEHRISTLSSSKEVFENEIGFYEKALKNSGYNHKMKYVTEKITKKRTRKRKIIYFNPPFSKSVKTRIGKMFLQLIDHHFDRTHILRKYFNRSTVKVSYRTLNNVKKHISKHNAKVSNNLKKSDENENERKCNCTKKSKKNCPLEGHCLQKSVIYQAHVTTNNKTMTYTGMTKNTFKQRFNGHNATIKKRPLKEKVTTLSDYVWKLKDQKVPFTIKWAIKSKAYAFSSGGKSCDLCITEKMTIMLADQRYSLNQRKELLSKCPHKRQFCLKKHSENSTIT